MSRRRQHRRREHRKRDADLGGVRGAARVQGAARNTRDPSAQPSSRQGGSYKPKAKSSARAAGVRGDRSTDDGRAPNNARRREGPLRVVMSATKVSARAWPARPVPTTPIGRRPIDKVRQLQRRLWAAAKQSPERRFHALYDRIWRSDVLQEAWKRVKRNRGAAGVDGQTIADVEQYGVERFLEELGDELRAGEYRPSAVLRRYIPKADGKKRPLGIPTVRDRVVQMAAKLVLEPIFEADFLPCSYGFRPKRSATMALETAAQARRTRRQSRARRRHPRLLRQHRSRQADEARRATRLGSTGAQAAAAVARSRGDGRRRA